MDIAKNAAKYMRMTWQGHDERSEKMFKEGARRLYEILTDVSNGLNEKAGEMLMKAYWKSDEAEAYQKLGNSKKEDKCYNDAEKLIRDSRALVGLETKSAEFTAKWWRAYRHKDENALFENLVQEHLCQITGNNIDVAKRCTNLIIKATAEHKKRDWRAVENTLTEYFEIYLPAILRKF
jgi:hypothetical protein